MTDKMGELHTHPSGRAKMGGYVSLGVSAPRTPVCWHAFPDVASQRLPCFHLGGLVSYGHSTGERAG